MNGSEKNVKYHHSFTDYLYWNLVMAVPIVTALIALYRHSLIWVPVYIALLIVLVTVIVKFYCSHCPHYVRGNRVVRCMLFWGVLKFVQERPGPLRIHEKVIALTAAVIIVLLPLYWLIRSPGLLVIYVLSFSVMVLTMRRYECGRCIYVDCPSNRVAKIVSEGTSARKE